MALIVPAVISGLATVGAAAAYAVGIGTSIGSAAAFLGGAAAIVGAGVVTAGVALAGVALKGLMPDITMPQSDNDQTRQQTVRGTVEPQKLVYGEALVSGPIFFVGVAGTDNNTLYHAIALTGHEVDDITDIHFDNEVITDAQINQLAQVTGGEFGPTSEEPSEYICLIERKTGSSTQTSSQLLTPTFNDWTSDHRAQGISYVVTQWKLTDSSQEVWDRLKPQNIKALVKGKKDIYDPRLDTSAGANPTLEVYQQWSDNPALCVANYLTDTRFGLSIPVSKIDWDAVETAADACDVTVTVPNSGTQKRFTANGVLYATDTHRANINKLLSAMNGSLVYSNGIYTIRAGIYEAPTESLTEDDLAGPVTVRTSVERGNRFNTIKPVFIDPAQNHKSVEAPEVTLTAAINRDNGEVLRRDIELPFTNSSYMAQRIAHKQIQMSDQQKVLTFPANLTGLRVDVGDRVNITIAELNYSNKIFRCAGWSFSDTQDGVVNLTLLEDDSGSYDDPAANEYSTIAPSGTITKGFRGVPDPQNLSATAGLKNIELNWTAPVNSSIYRQINVYASPDSSWANSVKIGQVMGTQFIHDASNAVDPIAVGDTRYYWIRAMAYGIGSGPFVESDRNPDNDTSNIFATVGPNNPNYSDIVDDIPSQGAPTGLTLTETTTLGNDGSVLPAVQVSWTAPSPNEYVSYYEVEFKQTSAGEIDYGQVSDAYTAVIDYGSVGAATTLELNYGGVNEAITGAANLFSSVNVFGTSTVVAGMKELEEFTFRVRAVTFTGTTSGFITETITLQGDQTAPAIPGSIVATGGIQHVKLDYELPSDSDLAYVEIFENTTDNLNTASLIVRTKSDQHTVTGLGNEVTRYYWLRSVDRSGNTSAFSASFNATTEKITLDDLAQSVLDQFAEGDAFGIEPVTSLPASGDHVGQIKLLTTTNTLFVWTGSAWSDQIFTASSVDPGSITAASFASGVEPVSVVTSLPSPTGYTGPVFVFNTGDSPPKIYRYDSSVPEFTALVNTNDLTGTLPENIFSDDLRPVERVATLPTTGLTTGRVVMLTTDSKLYRYSGTAWTTAISAVDLDDQVNLATQVFGQVQASNLTAGQVNTDALAANAITAAKISAGSIGTSQLAADSVTASKIAADAVTASEILANTITSAEINTSQLFADSAVIGAIQSGSITTSAVVSAIGSFEFIQSSNIVAGAITGSKISADTIEANKLKIDNITLDTDGDNLIIKTAGVGTTQLSLNAVTDSSIVEAANKTITSTSFTATGLSASVTVPANGTIMVMVSYEFDLTKASSGTLRGRTQLMDGASQLRQVKHMVTGTNLEGVGTFIERITNTTASPVTKTISMNARVDSSLITMVLTEQHIVVTELKR